MTSRQKFILACLLIASGLGLVGFLTADQWLAFAASLFGSPA